MTERPKKFASSSRFKGEDDQTNSWAVTPRSRGKSGTVHYQQRRSK